MAKKSFKIRSNLAEALDDTVTSAKNNAGQLHIEVIPLRKIELDPDNPRELSLTIDDVKFGVTQKDKLYDRKTKELKTLESLSKSIKEQGVLNAIIVYQYGKKYKLIAGERRSLASHIAGKVDIPARVLTSKPDVLNLSLIQWIENIERSDLSLWERFRNLEKIVNAYSKSLGKDFVEIKPTELSKLLGCSIQHGVNYRHILNSSELLKKHIKNGDIGNIEKVALISKSNTKDQLQLIKACIKGATLSQLKKITSKVEVDENIGKSKKLNFTLPTNEKAVKKIIKIIFDHDEFSHLKLDEFSEVNWNDTSSALAALKKLLKSLE